MNSQKLLIGIDIGSTTTKIVAMQAESGKVIYADYSRHHAMQLDSARRALEAFRQQQGDTPFLIALTGSGAKPVAELLGVPFIQEVVANSIALRHLYPDVLTAIELGGQDAKIIFFKDSEDGGPKQVADMRMNGSCAGGTGAFIDEVAEILKTNVEDFNAAAERGTSVYDVSGRCGVFAKTDIQPLLNQGVSRDDLALSTFHAIAKQTIGGLAQGMEIKKPVAFEGGPLTFNPRMIEVFAERLGLQGKDIVIPEHPETIVALGAAYSCGEMFASSAEVTAGQLLETIRLHQEAGTAHERECGPLYFENEEQRQEFFARHPKPQTQIRSIPPGTGTIDAYLGMDSGSTTTKFVLIDTKGNILWSFYGRNEGDPLATAKSALIHMRDAFAATGHSIRILSAGTTGYGEMLFYKAFSSDMHTVETVAHATAAAKYAGDVSFILDIGGQDMKGIWLDHGIISNIVVNEACSSGCGSFLENFASSLGIPVQEIAQAAFDSKAPAKLGSRCTVFMNSSIITEQRNGSNPQDIMAGLCRSIIENVFTKVIRLANLDSLGDRIMVQGGTFQNDAVLRALEQYSGKEVIRAPYPGLMGAIGAALLAQDYRLRHPGESTFQPLADLETFSYTQEANLPCPFCTNHCRRSVVHFSNGESWVTNNRCEKGEVLGDPKDAAVREKALQAGKAWEGVPDLFAYRRKILFEKTEYVPVCEKRGITIGIPRVLLFWEMYPFWDAFFGSLGFDILLSPETTRAIYEKGLPAVTSDTECFPAKMVHGHFRWLEAHGADRIFFPAITAIKSENTEKTSESMCALVKGYPLVMRNSDNPKDRGSVPLDAPLFHWHDDVDRRRQLRRFMAVTFGVKPRDTDAAITFGDLAQVQYREKLEEEGGRVIRQVKEDGSYAIVLASRPYQNDPLVNHELPLMFTKMGIPVLTADSIREVKETDLSHLRLDAVNNFHSRMLSSAIIAAKNSHLEYVQIVSFGCGHDAYLSDEIIRIMKEISGKTPLVLKLDESDVQGPLRIRVRSFLETISMRRALGTKAVVRDLQDPYPVKFEKSDKPIRKVLIPNTSHAFCRLMSAAMKAQGLQAEPLPIGRDTAIELGKKFVHNDICFPAQIVIGEALAALESGKYKVKETAVAMGKYIGDCRLTHYSALLRKALDDAGFGEVPIVTNDDVDYHDQHPGYKMNLSSSVKLAFALPMIDALEELLRKIRPYELHEGESDEAFEKAMDSVINGLEKNGLRGARKGFIQAVDIMKKVPYDRSRKRPTVLIVGEYLLNFHPGANHDIEKYLEDNGFEIIEARMTDVIRKTYFYQRAQALDYKVKKSFRDRTYLEIVDKVFNMAHSVTDQIAKAHPLYHQAPRMQDITRDSDPVVPRSFDTGEGVLIPAEIIHHAREGCRNFIILQPFGCLPNHVVGRGIVRRLREMFPDVQILSLDYDPDVSFANIENRLQMMINNTILKK